jgi:hypothetical protein
VLKFGLVAIGILSGFSYFIGSIIENALASVGGEETEAHRKFRFSSMLVGLGIVAASLIVILILSYFLSDHPNYSFVALIHYTVAMFILFVFYLVDRFRNPTKTTAREWASDFFFFIIVVYFVGMTIGHVTKESTGFNRDLYTLHGEYRDVGLIMITSRYVVIFRDDHSIIIPVGDVTKIEARPRHTTG